MDREEFDRLLGAALSEANRLDSQNLGEEHPTAPWSADYRRQRAQMLKNPLRWYRKRSMPAWKRAGRAVASILLVVIVGLSATLAISPAARRTFAMAIRTVSETLIPWVQEIYQTHVEYHFGGEPVAEELPQYEITNLPQGYREVDRFALVSLVGITYENDMGHTIYFDYSHMRRGSARIILMEDMERIDAIVNGWEGHFYESQVPTQSNALVWMDMDRNLQFMIDGFEDEDTLRFYAENIALKN